MTDYTELVKAINSLTWAVRAWLGIIALILIFKTTDHSSEIKSLCDEVRNLKAGLVQAVKSLKERER